MLTVNHFRILNNIHKYHLRRNGKNSAEAIRIFLHAVETSNDFISTNHLMKKLTIILKYRDIIPRQFLTFVSLEFFTILYY